MGLEIKFGYYVPSARESYTKIRNEVNKTISDKAHRLFLDNMEDSIREIRRVVYG